MSLSCCKWDNLVTRNCYNFEAASMDPSSLSFDCINVLTITGDSSVINGENQQLITDEPVEFERYPIQIQDFQENY